MERYTLTLRILVTLLILAMLLPGWGLLNAASRGEQAHEVHTEAIGTVSPLDR